MADAEERGREQAWDRIGRFFQDMTDVGTVVAQRNLDLWSRVSRDIRKADYGAENIGRDMAKAFSTALDNLDDIWTSLTRAQQRELTAGALPEVFLYIPLKDGAVFAHALAGPVWIDLAPHDVDRLPSTAEISLFGPPDGIEDLRGQLKVDRVIPRGYLVSVRQETNKQLTPGFYSGVIYVAEPVRPLASLRVVVEAAPQAGEA
jgi:hypothetical protein